MRQLVFLYTLVLLSADVCGQIRSVIKGPDTLCVGQNSEYFVNVEKYPNMYLLCDSTRLGAMNAGFNPEDISGSFTYDFRVLPLKSIDIRSARCTDPSEESYSLLYTQQNWAIYPVNASTGYLSAGVSIGTNGIVIGERSGNLVVARLIYEAPVSDWVHVAVVLRPGSIFLYLDGQLVRSDSLPATGTRCITPYFAGVSMQCGFKGGLDEIRIWDQSLSADELGIIEDKKILGHTSGLRYYAGFDTGEYVRTSGDLGTVNITATGYSRSLLKFSSWDLQSYSGTCIKSLTVFDIHNLSYLWSTGSNNASIAYSPLAGNNTIFVKIYNPVLSKNALFSIIDSITITGTMCAETPVEGLVAYYPLNGNAKDESVFRNDGVAEGPEPSADMYGKANGALYFDGEDDLIRIAGSLPVADYFTVSFIALSLNETGFSTILNDGGAGSSANSMILDLQGNDIGLCADKNAVLNYDDVTLPELQNLDLLNRWVNVVWVMTPSYSKVFLNGTLKATIYEPGSNTGFHNDFSFIGARQGVTLPEHFFKGKLDELKFYNRELSDNEVETLYQNCNFETARSLYTDMSSDPDLDNLQILIYPNPATDYLVVETSDFSEFEEDQVRIVNLSGNTIYTTSITAYRNQINLPDLKGQGMFIVQIFSPEGVVKASKKIIFQ